MARVKPRLTIFLQSYFAIFAFLLTFGALSIWYRQEALSVSCAKDKEVRAPLKPSKYLRGFFLLDDGYDWPIWTYDFNLQPWRPVQTEESNNKKLQSRLPKAICIGAKKCGTDALMEFLALNPLVKKPEHELHFFDSGKYHNGLKYYRKQFPKTLPSEIGIEKSPRYFISSRVPQRIWEAAPEVKIILVLCDPVKRVVSDFAFSRQTLRTVYRRLQMRVFENINQYLEIALNDLEIIRQDPNKTLGYSDFDSFLLNSWNQRTFYLNALTIGMYSRFLKHWLVYFPMNQIHIVDGDDLIRDPGEVIQKVQRFLRTKPTVGRANFVFNKTKGFYCGRKTIKDTPTCLSNAKGKTRGKDNPGTISDIMTDRLRKLYRPYDEELMKLLGRKMSWMR